MKKGDHRLMQSTRILQSLCCFLLVLPSGIFAPFSDRAGEIDQFMTTLHKRGQFSGSILVAKDGKVIYRDAFGEADWQTHRKFTPATISNLASVSKQFTAMAVMMLAEQRKLQYEDPVVKFLPELSGALQAITLRHLLQHTSGIPDVGDLGVDRPQLTNEDVIQRLTNPDFRVSPPGEKYRYSNTNYILLAVVVERVSRQGFVAFLTEKIFKPLAMNDTFVNPDTNLVAKAYDQFGNPANANARITGSGGIYSTVDDLLKWDQALYTERLARQSTLAEAFLPGQVKTGASTYGFGWNVGAQDGQNFVWHQGSTGGYRSLIKRMLEEKIAVIILTNQGNSKRLEISDAILNILHGKAYVFPKRSIAVEMYAVLNKQGIQAALKTYQSLRSANDDIYDFGEGELNALGYQVLGANRNTNEAIEIFKLNTTAYPQSSNAFDSLGDAYQASGNKELAVKSYQKAVELDPTNLNSVRMLKKLQ
jgi:CubicO group peptidase (beta-lactamase class C family)